MNEIREAAERLIANCWDTYLAVDPQTRDMIQVCDTILADGRSVARAFLAANPADDATEIDEAWVRSVGFIYEAQRGSRTDVWCYSGLILCKLANDWRMQVGGVAGMWEYMAKPTRGSVRRIVEILGSGLREAPCQTT